MHRLFIMALISVAFATRALGQESLALCMENANKAFIKINEHIVQDALTSLPASLQGASHTSVTEYLKALGQDKAPIPITNDLLRSNIIKIGEARYIVYTTVSTFVRRSAVSVVDQHPGITQYLPPTPAVPGGAQALAQPISHGFTLIAASGRIFCGVRSNARTLAITSKDVADFAQMAKVPTASDFMNLVSE
jgi:hypothetical protein